MSYYVRRQNVSHDLRRARLMGMDAWLASYVDRELAQADSHFAASKRGAKPSLPYAERTILYARAAVELHTLHEMIKAFIADAVASAWKVNKIALRARPRLSIRKATA